MKNILYLLVVIGIVSCSGKTQHESNEVLIQWSETVPGDFSFTENWSYPEGIFTNRYGQLSCDGTCPPGIENMMDGDGKIFTDSLSAFYNLVDTTHLFHSIASKTSAHEWAGTNFISATRISTDTVQCTTLNNAGTHSSLNMIIVNDIVKPTIIVNSVNSSIGFRIYECLGGEIVIDKDLWHKGILKASFDFRFDNIYNSNEPIYWKGRIHTIIQNP